MYDCLVTSSLKKSAFWVSWWSVTVITHLYCASYKAVSYLALSSQVPYAPSFFFLGDMSHIIRDICLNAFCFGHQNKTELNLIENIEAFNKELAN